MPPAPTPDRQSGADRAAIEEAAQRTAEQAALRKVRKRLDHIEAEETRRGKVIRVVALVGVLAIVGVMVLVWVMLSANRDQLRGTPVEIPRSAGKK